MVYYFLNFHHNLNLAYFNNQLKLKLNKQKKENIEINYKKLLNNKSPISMKRNGSAINFIQFKKNINKELPSKININDNDNKNNIKKIKYHNSSDIMS